METIYDLNDYEILNLACERDEEALELMVIKYKPLVHAKANKYCNNNNDIEDYIQEGLYALIKAIYSYDQDKKVPFKAYAEQCVTNQMLSYLRNSKRKKHMVLNTSVSIDDDTIKRYVEASSSSYETVEDVVMTKHYFKDTYERLMERLSDIEKIAFKEYYYGHSYEEISKRHNKEKESIYNAVYRTRTKLEKLLK